MNWTDRPVLVFCAPSGLVLGGVVWEGGDWWVPLNLTPSPRAAHDIVLPLDGWGMLRIWIGEHALRAWRVDARGEHEISLRPNVGANDVLEDPDNEPAICRALGDGWVQVDEAWISPEGEVFLGDPPPVAGNPDLAAAIRGWSGTTSGWAALIAQQRRHPGKPLPSWVGEAGWMDLEGDRLRGRWEGREWEVPARRLWTTPDGRWLAALPGRIWIGCPEGPVREIPWEGLKRLYLMEAQPLGDGWLVRTPEQCMRVCPDGQLEILPPFPMFPEHRAGNIGGWRIFWSWALRPGFAVPLRGGPMEVFPDGLMPPEHPGWMETLTGGIIRLPPEGRAWQALEPGRLARLIGRTPPPYEGVWVLADRPAALLWLPASHGWPAREILVPGQGEGGEEFQAQCVVLPGGALLAMGGWVRGNSGIPRESIALVAWPDREDPAWVPLQGLPADRPVIRPGPDRAIFVAFPGQSWALLVYPGDVHVVHL